MSYKVNSRDVLEYLNELGYQDISALQLKEFIKDLKRLIKYEQKVREDQENNFENIYAPSAHKKLDIFTTLYEAGTTSSKAKEVSRREKVISVQIKKPLSKQCSEPDESIHKTSSSINMSRVDNNILSYNEQNNIICDNVESDFGHRPKSSGYIERGASQTSKVRPKASFIRPRIPLKPCKSDPVALYHHYQAEWKRQKIPGEDNHADLRWVIREKMLGNIELPSNAPRLEKFRKKGSGTRL